MVRIHDLARHGLARMCKTNNCPSGIATPKPGLRHRLKVDEVVSRLA